MSREQTASEILTAESTIVASRDQISSDVAGETVILDLKGGVYFGLDPIGSRIWSMVQLPVTVAEICDTLTKEYDVDAAQCERDVIALLEELAERALVTVGHAPSR